MRGVPDDYDLRLERRGNSRFSFESHEINISEVRVKRPPLFELTLLLY